MQVIRIDDVPSAPLQDIQSIVSHFTDRSGDVIELTEEPGIDEEAAYLDDTGGALHVRSVRRWVSEWEATDDG